MHKHSQSRLHWLVLFASYLVVAFLGYVDYKTGDYSLLIFYVVPVSAVAWMIGIRGAVAISIAAGGARMVSDYYAYSATTFRYFNSIQDMLFLLLAGFLISFIKKLLQEKGN